MSLRQALVPALLAAASLLACGSLDNPTTTTHTSSLAGAESSEQGWVGGHSCEEQASWGKCSESWMHPVCSYACGGSASAAVSQSGSSSQGGYIDGHSCEEQASWGKCSESWMHPVCSYACGGSQQVYYWVPSAPSAPAQPAPQQPQYGGSTLPYPFNNNGLMIPRLSPYELWSNNTGLLYPSVGGSGSFPYSNSTTNGVMGTGTGLVTTNIAGGYAYSPYWNGGLKPY